MLRLLRLLATDYIPGEEQTPLQDRSRIEGCVRFRA